MNSNVYDPARHNAHKELNALNINFSVAQPTMPANYFHILRRQMLRNYRKPLVIATPKIGLKHPLALSPIQDFAEKESFQPVISQLYKSERTTDQHQVIFCSGKIGFDLQQILTESQPNLSANVHVLKVEELAPFPTEAISTKLGAIPPQSIRSYTWIQEEPANQGAFAFAKLHIDRILDDLNASTELQFIGRPSMHSFCSGASVDHKAQTEQIRAQIDELIRK